MTKVNTPNLNLPTVNLPKLKVPSVSVPGVKVPGFIADRLPGQHGDEPATPPGSGKVALVTGASSGIGAATVHGLLEAGYTVYAVARRVDRMSELADAGAHVMAMDVTDDGSMVAGIEAILGESGRIDLLVNNAGYGSYGALEDVPLDEARRQFEVNVFGMARLIQLALPVMREQGSGRIINVSSIGGQIWEPFGSWYHATKFAVEGLSDSLRVEVAPLGIQVVLIQPGPIRTEWNRIARENLVEVSGDGPYGDRARAYAAGLERTDEGRMSAEPDVVARAIVKAATAGRPHTRYPVGGGARAILAANSLLPDRAFDMMIEKSIGG